MFKFLSNRWFKAALVLLLTVGILGALFMAPKIFQRINGLEDLDSREVADASTESDFNPAEIEAKLQELLKSGKSPEEIAEELWKDKYGHSPKRGIDSPSQSPYANGDASNMGILPDIEFNEPEVGDGFASVNFLTDEEKSKGSATNKENSRKYATVESKSNLSAEEASQEQLKDFLSKNMQDSDRFTPVLDQLGETDKLVVYFDFDHFKLSTRPSLQLGVVAAHLNDEPARRVKLFGFTDGKGSREYNERLAHKRAESVASKLQELGVSVEQILPTKNSGNLPMSSDVRKEEGVEMPTGQASQRRVEIHLSKI